VERANRTLQDGLVKELRLAEISTVAAGNDFLSRFIERLNGRFAVVPVKPDDLHRKVHLPTSRFTDILCHREQRYLSCAAHLPLRPQADHPGTQQDIGELAGKYVDLYDYKDGKLEVRWKGISLPYRVFAKDQRITQTPILGNKRLSHALSLVKAQQELKRETKVLTNSERAGYKKRPWSVYGPDFIDNALAPKSGDYGTYTDILLSVAPVISNEQQHGLCNTKPKGDLAATRRRSHVMCGLDVGI
jgi:hypothetical protein